MNDFVLLSYTRKAWHIDIDRVIEDAIWDVTISAFRKKLCTTRTGHRYRNLVEVLLELTELYR